MKILSTLVVMFATSLTAVTTALTQEANGLGIDYTIIGGGRVAGLYFPAAGALCEMFNRQNATTRCYVESNPDSFVNLQALRNGAIDFAIVQSDWVRKAAMGIGPFREEGAHENLRTIFSLHGEALTLLATKSSGVSSSRVLAKMRVNIGPNGTYQRLLSDWLLEAQGLGHWNFAKILDLPEAEQMAALCNGEVDVITLVAAHPSPRVAEITSRCNASVIPIDLRAIKKLVKRRNGLSQITIPSGYYSNSSAAIKSFGLRAVLVTNERVGNAIVDFLARSVFGNLDALRAQHPVFAALDADTMAKDGMGAALHDGARPYFKERGWR